MGGQIRERVTGSDIFRDVYVELNRLGGYRVFFLGSTEDTLAAIRQRLTRDYPNLQVAGTYSPPCKAEAGYRQLGGKSRLWRGRRWPRSQDPGETGLVEARNHSYAMFDFSGDQPLKLEV